MKKQSCLSINAWLYIRWEKGTSRWCQLCWSWVWIDQSTCFSLQGWHYSDLNYSSFWIEGYLAITIYHLTNSLLSSCFGVYSRWTKTSGLETNDSGSVLWDGDGLDWTCLFSFWSESYWLFSPADTSWLWLLRNLVLEAFWFSLWSKAVY